jgi:hypothetical protein
MKWSWYILISYSNICSKTQVAEACGQDYQSLDRELNRNHHNTRQPQNSVDKLCEHGEDESSFLRLCKDLKLIANNFTGRSTVTLFNPVNYIA